MIVLGILGFLAIVVGIVILIVSAIRKRQLRTGAIVAGIGLLAFVVGMSLSPSESSQTTTPPTATYRVNEDVTVGSTAKWRVTSVRDRGSVLEASESRYGMFGEDRVTVGKFIEVTFVVENIGGKTETVMDDPILVDNTNREFRPAEGYSGYVPRGLDFGMVILQPNIPKEAIIIYEVPQDSVGLKLRVSDFAWLFPNTALIDLGL